MNAVKTHISLSGKRVPCKAEFRTCPRGGHEAVNESSPAEGQFQEAGKRAAAADLDKFLPISEPRKIFTEEDNEAFKLEAAEFAQRIDSVTSPEEAAELKEALIYYTGFNHASIRDLLHGYHFEQAEGDDPWGPRKKAGRPIEFSEERKQELSGWVEKLDKVLTLTKKLDEPRMLYRGATVPGTVPNRSINKWLTDNYKIGSVWSNKTFTSTTVDPDGNDIFISTPLGFDYNQDRHVIFEFLTREGAPLGVTTADMGAAESEVLLPRNKNFRIVGLYKYTDYAVEYQSSEGKVAPFTTKRTVIQLVDCD
jgi:hypothetical protein